MSSRLNTSRTLYLVRWLRFSNCLSRHNRTFTFRIQYSLANENQVKLELLALDVGAQKRIKKEIGAGKLTARGIEDLRSYSAANLCYCEVDVGQDVAYLNSVDGTSINSSVLDSTDVMNILGKPN